MSIATASPQCPDRLSLDTIDLQCLGARLREIPAQSATEDDAVVRLVELVLPLLSVFGVAYFSRDDQGRLTLRPRHYAPAQVTQLPSLLQQSLRLAAVACSEGKAQATRCEDDGPWLVVAVPIGLDADRDEAIGVIASATDQQTAASLPLIMQSLHLLAAFVSQWKGREDDREAAVSATDLAVLLDMLPAAAAGGDLRSCGHRIAESLRQLLGCEMVAIGAQHGNQSACRLVAISTHEQFDRQADVVRDIEEVMNESLLWESLPEQRTATGGERAATSAFRRLQSRAQAEFVACYPLGDEGSATSVALVVFADDDPLTKAGTSQRFEQIKRFVPSLIHLCIRSQPGRLRRLCQRAAGPRRLLRKPIFWAVLGLGLAAMVLPLRYQVRCDCQIQPAQRRYVSVPYEGRLEEALVAPGDLVRAGQTLAVMDGREIQWELGTLQADLNQADKEKDTALASFDTAAAQIARMETERLRLKTRLLQDRMEHLEIRSPLDGIVMGGDPQELAGARMKMGQTLLEIGPLDDMVVELAIGDDDISHVEVGQPVRFRLAAQPFQKQQGTIARIHPQSEVRDNENVFLARVKIDSVTGDLRPGMEGSAKVSTARHMLGWNLFHKAWYALLYRYGW